MPCLPLKRVRRPTTKVKENLDVAEENLDVAQESLATPRNYSSTNNNKDVVSCPSSCSDWFKSKKDYDNDLTKHLVNVICSPAPSFMRRLEEI